MARPPPGPLPGGGPSFNPFHGDDPMTIRGVRAAVTACVLGALDSAGCSRDTTARDVASMNQSNIQRLSNLYAAHQNGKGGQGPRDEAGFQAFIKEFDPNKLAMMGVDANNVDAVFTSERDNKPFRV